MAFRQPQHRPQPSRQVLFPFPTEQSDVAPAVAPQRKRTLEESEEWVLFSPGTAPSVTEKTHTTSTERTPRTAGLSRLSDFGSLDTAARSDQNDEEDDDITEHGTEPDEEAELDSLDDGLHAFHESSEYSNPARAAPILDTGGGSLLPTHDGLGSFGDNSAAMQQQLWQFEQRYTPRRKVRRTSSVQRTLDALEDADELSQESERMRRIEKWRLEQSRALLEEIERETRRMRRMSRASTRSRTESIANAQTKSQANSSATTASTPVATEVPQPAVVEERPSTDNESESFWQRFTQRVIRDLIGIDENLLSIILGEALPAEVETQPTPSEPQPSIEKVISIENREAQAPIEETWQHRLLERIARELGILVHQLSSHPGAFSTYLQSQETPTYAGLPNTATSIYGTSSDPTMYGFTRHSAGSPADVAFNPTLQTQQHSEASLWGIEEEPDVFYEPANVPPATAANEAERLAQEREYWERELDVKMVFNFLKSRFSSRPSSPLPAELPPLSLPADPADLRRTSVFSQASSGVPNSARRAALIKQHHPLTSRNLDSSNRRNSLSHRHHLHHFQHGAQPGPAAAILRNRVSKTGSSCASQSTKKSRKSGSSRNYWDIGGSVGSGPAGGVGIWGEVVI